MKRPSASNLLDVASARDRKAAIAAAVKRLDEQIAKEEANKHALDDRRRAYQELHKVLEELPGKVQHPVMVPFGPLAFFEGYIEHTNEVTVQLSSDWFVLKTAKAARETLHRRDARLKAEEQNVLSDLKELKMKRRVAAGEDRTSQAISAEIDVSDAPAGTTAKFDEDGFLDIREPYDPTVDAKAAPDGSHLTATAGQVNDVWADTLDKLKALEAQEDDADELDELEELVQAYDEEGEAAKKRFQSSAQPSNEAGAACLASRSEAMPSIQSPADIGRLIQATEEAQAPVVSGTEGRPPGGAFAAIGSAFSGEIHERRSTALPVQTEQQTGSRSDVGAPRVSKFKSDRHKSGR